MKFVDASILSFSGYVDAVWRMFILECYNVSLFVRVPCFNEISSGDVRDTILRLKFSFELVEVFNVKVLYINYFSCKAEFMMDCGNTGNVVHFFSISTFSQIDFRWLPQ